MCFYLLSHCDKLLILSADILRSYFIFTRIYPYIRVYCRKNLRVTKIIDDRQNITIQRQQKLFYRGSGLPYNFLCRSIKL